MIEIERMTPYEFELQVTAFRLKKLDQQHDLHLQAWLAQQVQATKKIGKKEVPYFKSFKDFFDFEKNEREILGQKDPSIVSDGQLNDLIRNANL